MSGAQHSLPCCASAVSHAESGIPLTKSPSPLPSHGFEFRNENIAHPDQIGLQALHARDSLRPLTSRLPQNTQYEAPPKASALLRAVLQLLALNSLLAGNNYFRLHTSAHPKVKSYGQDSVF